MFSALIFYITLPMLPQVVNVLAQKNKTYLPDLMKGYYFVDHVKYNKAIYVYESLICLATVFIFCSVDSMYAATIEHCVGLFTIVKYAS